MTANERRTLVDAWLNMQRNWWAAEELRRQHFERPQECWSTLLSLVESAEHREMLETIGAGPLEDFLRLHASEFITKVESAATSNAKFRAALGNVWLPRRQDSVTQRLVALGCQLVGEQL